MLDRWSATERRDWSVSRTAWWDGCGRWWRVWSRRHVSTHSQISVVTTSSSSRPNVEKTRSLRRFRQGRCFVQRCYEILSLVDNSPLTLWRPLLPLWVQAAIKHAVPDRVKSSFVIFDIRALWRSGLSVPGCQKLQMTGLNRSGTGCFIAVPIWQHSKGSGTPILNVLNYQVH